MRFLFHVHGSLSSWCQIWCHAAIECPCWKFVCLILKHKRSEFDRIRRPLISHRQYVKQPETAPHRGLAIVEWVPNKTYSRLEVANCRIVFEPVIADSRRCASEAGQGSDVAMHLI